MTQARWDTILGGGAGWALGDHLWQSTLGFAIAALFVWLAGPGRPSLRHAIWLVASVKFLVPFSLLIALGESLAPVLMPVPLPSFGTATFQIVGEPFTIWAEARAGMTSVDNSFALFRLLPIAAVVIWATGALTLFTLRWTRGRKVRSIVAAGTALTAGREVDAVRRVLARSHSARRTVAVRLVPGVTAPALFGLRRALLLWPAGLSVRLSDDAMEAIVAHEIAHFHRRDNVAALVHTVVETVFWFHPLVWWMSARLVEERERACDREALDAGVPPRTYAETLVNTCRFGLAVPQPFVASAAGSSLARRVEVIMNYRPRRLVAPPRGFTVVLASLLILWPVAIGIGRAHEPGITHLPAGPDTTPATVALPTPPEIAESSAVEPPARPTDGPVGPLRLPASRPEESQAPVSPAAPSPRDPKQTSPSQEDLEFRQGALAPGTPGLTSATTVRTFQPTYTSGAMRRKVQGSVEVEIVVGPEGAVERARVTRSLDPELDEQALIAIRQWRFDPATRDERPVAMWMRCSMDFRLY